MDYYAILGITPSASDEEMKKAYKDLVKKYHPDNNLNDEESTNKLKEINMAYDVLKDPIKRKEYDQKEGYNNRASQMSNDFNAGFYDAESYKEKAYDVGFYDAEFQNEEAYDNLLRVLDQAEKELKPFNRSFTNFREKIKEKRGILTEEQIENYVKTIWKTVRTIKENSKEFDKFMKVVEQYEEELKPFNENLVAYKKMMALKRGTLTWQEIEFEKKPQLASYVKNIKAFITFIQYINELEREANLYGKSLNEFKRKILPQKGKITFEQIENLKVALGQELLSLKENCHAYDEWMKKIEEYEIELAPLQEDLNEYKKSISSKRGELTPKQIKFEEIPKIENYVQKIKVFSSFMDYLGQVENEISIYGKSLDEYKKNLEKQKENLTWQEIVELRANVEAQVKSLKLKNPQPPKNLLELKREFIRRRLDWNTYLKEQKLNEKEINQEQIKIIFDSLLMMDELQKLLDITVKISLEKLLEKIETTKYGMENAELHALYEKMDEFFIENRENKENKTYFLQNFPYNYFGHGAKR